jgi:lipoprotein-releasing system ATP-binding protein
LDEDELTGYRNRTIGFIFQFHFLLKDFDALENVLMPAYLRANKLGQARNRAINLLKEVGLEKRAHHFPSELSGGERQRVAVARALMNDPGLILADEPTGNLDERNSSIVEELLFELVEKYRKTLLLMTHDKYIAGKAHEQYELLHGELVAVSTA